MQLQEALEELRSSLLRDKSSLKSGPEDHFWSDDQLVRYINDACRRFAKLSLCIRDSVTPEVVEVTLVSGVSLYTLHPSIISVISARHELATNDLVRVSHPNAVNTLNRDTDLIDFPVATTDGRPRLFSTDEGLDPDEDHAIQLRLFGVPTDNASEPQTGKRVFLRTARKPLNTLTLDDLKASLEIPEDYCLDMLEGAAWRALRNWELDGEDRAKAEQHDVRFRAAAAEAKKDIERKMRQPMVWAFGAGGFGGYCR